MKLKKIAAMLMAGVMCIGLMAGCGSSDKNAQTDSTDPKDRTQLTVGFDAEFPPYGYKNGDDYEGFDLDLAQAVCDYYGWKLVKQPIDWDSKDMELNSGSIDCIWNGFTITGREEDYTWSEPYVDNSIVVVVSADSDIQTLDDLAGKVVATQADSSALAALTDDSEDNADNLALAASFADLQQVSDYNSAFMNLESGAVDAIAVDIGVAKYQVGSRGDAFRMLDDAISTEQYAVGFKLGNTDLRDTVQNTLDEMAADGTVDKIAQNYADYNLPEMLCIEK